MECYLLAIRLLAHCPGVTGLSIRKGKKMSDLTPQETLRVQRVAKGYTQQALADALGLTLSMVQYTERNGGRRVGQMLRSLQRLPAIGPDAGHGIPQSQPRAKPVRKAETAKANPTTLRFVEWRREMKNHKRTVYWLEGGKLCSREDVNG